MKFLGIHIETKKELRERIRMLENQLEFRNNEYDELVIRYNDACSHIEELITECGNINNTFPLDIGQVVYDVQLRSASGRYTKKKASREHSLVNEVVVDRKNYFGLVERLESNDVFFSKEAAEEHLNSVCID